MAQTKICWTGISLSDLPARLRGGLEMFNSIHHATGWAIWVTRSRSHYQQSACRSKVLGPKHAYSKYRRHKEYITEIIEKVKGGNGSTSLETGSPRAICPILFDLFNLLSPPPTPPSIWVPCGLHVKNSLVYLWQKGIQMIYSKSLFALCTWNTVEITLNSTKPNRQLEICVSWIQ